MTEELKPFTHEYYEAKAVLQIEKMIVGNHFTEEQVERIIKLLRMVQIIERPQ